MTYPAIAVFTGSRDLTWERGADAIRYQLSRLPAGSLVLHGACPCRVCSKCPCAEIAPRTHLPVSADVIVDRIARQLGHDVDRWFADWQSFGRGAGPRRNREMVDYGIETARELGVPIRCCGFPLAGGRGTRDCMGYAQERGVPVYRWRDAEPLPRGAILLTQ